MNTLPTQNPNPIRKFMFIRNQPCMAKRGTEIRNRTRRWILFVFEFYKYGMKISSEISIFVLKVFSSALPGFNKTLPVLKLRSHKPIRRVYPYKREYPSQSYEKNKNKNKFRHRNQTTTIPPQHDEYHQSNL